MNSRWARSARAAASSRAAASRPTSSSAAEARLLSALTWPWSRARPSRRSAAARSSPATRRSSSTCCCSTSLAGRERFIEGPRRRATSTSISRSWARTCSASASSCSGSRPDGTAGSAPSRALRTRSAASPAVPRSRSRSPDRANQVSCADGQGRADPRAAPPRAPPRLTGPRDRGLDLGAPLEQDRLVGQLLLERGPRGRPGRRPAAWPGRRGRRPARRPPCAPPRPVVPTA